MKTLTFSFKFLLSALILFLMTGTNKSFCNEKPIAFIKQGLENKYSFLNVRRLMPNENTYNNKATVTFTLAKTSRVKIKILDAGGREVADLMDKDVPAGTFEVKFETKKLKKGMYFCKFFTDEKVSMKKMILVN